MVPLHICVKVHISLRQFGMLLSDPLSCDVMISYSFPMLAGISSTVGGCHVQSTVVGTIRWMVIMFWGEPHPRDVHAAGPALLNAEWILYNA